MDSSLLRSARDVLQAEARALEEASSRLDAAFERAVDLLTEHAGKVLVTGIGKSGIIAQKIAATLASTGTAAFFLHPTEAIHGDLGMILEGDVVLAISHSGETEEVVALVPHVKRRGATLSATRSSMVRTSGSGSSASICRTVPRIARATVPGASPVRTMCRSRFFSVGFATLTCTPHATSGPTRLTQSFPVTKLSAA